MAKCQKHGVSVRELEGLFVRGVLIVPDSAHSDEEPRFRAIGKTPRGRSIFLVFTIRTREGKQLVRPISARYMHRKEKKTYEAENPDL